MMFTQLAAIDFTTHHGLASLAGSQCKTILQHREQAWQRLARLGWPTRKQEYWHYTPINRLLNHQFEAARSNETLDDLSAYHLPAGDYYPLVFFNGNLQQDLSHLPENCVVKSYQQLVDENDCKRLEKFFTANRALQDHSLALLNTACLTNGLFIKVPDNTIIDKPLHIININTEASISQLKHVIVLKPNAQCKIIETYIGKPDVTYFANVLTEVDLHPNAHLEYYKLHRDSLSAMHHSLLYANLQRDSHLRTTTISQGSQWLRSDIHAELNGKNSECELYGLFQGHEQQYIDHHTCINHRVANTHSREYYKGILSDKAMGVFNGKIIVAKDAQQVESQQMSKNLLLSERAEINTKPELEIYADDVKCQHGATVGQLDEQALFYLQSRGIGKALAETLLIMAFANEIIQQVPLPSLREYLLCQQ